MSASSGANIVQDGLVFAYDMESTQSYGKNSFSYATDLYQWFNVGARCTLARDTIQSPVGSTPLKMTVTSDTDPYTNTYVGTSWIITEAVQGETWTASCWVRSSVPTTTAIWIFECDANGTYSAISNPLHSINSTWQRISTTRTMANAGTASITIRFDGPDAGGNGVEIWYDGLQLERNSTVSSFSKVYNPNQKQILDWTGNNIITPTSLTYNSDNTFKFNGSTDYLTIPNKQLGNGNLPWSVSAWVKTTTLVNTLGHGSVLSNNASGPVYSMMGVNNGKIVYWTYQNSTWTQKLGVGTTVNDNNWHLLTWVNDPNYTMRMYVDGKLDSNVANSTSGNLNPVDVIGGSWTAKFDGSIAALKIYDKALTTAEVQQNFNALRSRFGI